MVIYYFSEFQDSVGKVPIPLKLLIFKNLKILLERYLIPLKFIGIKNLKSVFERYLVPLTFIIF